MEVAWIPESPPTGKPLWGQYCSNMIQGPAASASPESPWEKQSWARTQTRSIRVSAVGTRTLCIDRPSRWLWCTLNFENRWPDLHQIWCQWETSILSIHWGVVCQSAIACPVLSYPILWPPDAKNWLIGKDPDAGKDWRQEEKGMTEGEMVGWHHRLDWYEFEQASGVGDGQGGLACYSPWGRKELDSTGQLNWTELILTITENKHKMLNFSSTNLNIIWADPITFWPHSVIKILSV